MRHILVMSLVLAVTATAASAGKPKVAVLGLQPDSTADATLAKDVTVELRLRPKAGSGPFEIVPGGEVDLADAKATHKCANEARVCMAAAGAALGADFLIYGHVTRTAKGYTIALTLLDVRAKTSARALVDNLEKDRTKPADLAIWAKSAYGKLVDGADTRRP